MAEELPFKYVGGDFAIDLVNTIDWTSRGPESERLQDYERVTRWAEGAGVVSPRLGAALRRQAQAQPREAEAAYRAVQRARLVLQRMFAEIAQRRTSPDTVQDFNRLLGPALDHLRVVRSGSSLLQLGWEDQDRLLTSMLWPVLWSAAKLITSEEAAQIRICASEDCGWMYVDRSRNGLRRWCQMEVCGTREKTRRRRQGAV